MADGKTVLLTTQYLDEADHLAGRVAVIDRGKVIAEGTTGDLKASVGAGVIHVRVLDPERRSAAAAMLRTNLTDEVAEDADPVSISARVTSIRSLMFSDTDVAALTVTTVMCAGFLGVFGPITVRLYNRKT